MSQSLSDSFIGSVQWTQSRGAGIGPEQLVSPVMELFVFRARPVRHLSTDFRGRFQTAGFLKACVSATGATIRNAAIQTICLSEPTKRTPKIASGREGSIPAENRPLLQGFRWTKSSRLQRRIGNCRNSTERPKARYGMPKMDKGITTFEPKE